MVPPNYFSRIFANPPAKTSNDCIVVRLCDKTSVRRKNKLTVCIDHYLIHL